MSTYNTLPGLLMQHAKNFADKPALIYLNEDGSENARISYSALIGRSIYYAEKLKTAFQPGDRSLLMLNAGIDFVVAYLACLFSGVIAVPVNLPKRNKGNHRFLTVLKDSRPLCLMTDMQTEALLNKHFSDQRELMEPEHIIVDSSRDVSSSSAIKLTVEPNDTAYLQYTSGSTGQPRGVMVSHRNLMENSVVIRQSFNHKPDLIVANWLPPYHDMGLVGNLLQPLYVGGASVIINPTSFLKNPMLWFSSIRKYKANTTGCPNFALDYCVEKISDEQKKDIDLSSINVFYCGSEPIRKKSMDRFLSAFGDCGFREKMFLPCYGLAESTLMSTGISALEEPRYLSVDKKKLENEGAAGIPDDGGDKLELVSCGYPWPGHEIAVADPHTKQKRPDGRVGEIFIKGPSVSKGYWNDKEESIKVFGAQLEDSENSNYLSTGDLGFIQNGHLYITGRIKDLIIVRGLNHYPHDIEETVENSHEALQSNACAAFSVEVDEQEQLVVVAEIQRTHVRQLDHAEVFGAIKMAVAEEHDIPVYAITLLNPGRMLKTTSGKIQRGACRQAWLNGTLQSVGSWIRTKSRNKQTEFLKENPTVDSMKAWLILWLSNKLKISPDHIDPDQPIMSYGLDSIGAVELEREVTKAFGIEISLIDFMENNSINGIAKIGYNKYISN